MSGSQARGGPRAAGLAMAALLGVVAVVVAPSLALAGQDQIKLALLPVGQPGSYFDLTMRPGETRRLKVTIANDGDGASVARTFAADVYTITNGGFGARLSDEPETGTTAWLDYPADILELAPGSRVARSFSVTVPQKTGPGEYITSLILERDEPIAGGGVTINQVIRQAVAVVITVPGRRSPALWVGKATHGVTAGRSVVRIALGNIGNVRLKPVGDVTVLDATGLQVGAATVRMDTFYARTEAFIEVPLAALLAPGTYMARLTLGDAARGVPADTVVLAFVVDEPTPAATPGGSEAPGDVILGLGDGQTPVATLIVALIAVLILTLALATAIVFLLRRRFTTTPT